MKRLSMLGVVLVLLAVMVSSVSAHVIQYPSNDPDSSANAEHVILLPPTLPEAEASSAGNATGVVVDPSAEPESGKATPILF